MKRARVGSFEGRRKEGLHQDYTAKRIRFSDIWDLL